MKPFLPPLLILMSILTFSLVNCAVITHQTDRWTAQLETADELADGGRWEEAQAALKDSYRDWNGWQTWLHIVVKHEHVDGAEAMYRRAFAFSATQEGSEFRAEIADLRNQLRLVAEMEKVSIKNVL